MGYIDLDSEYALLRATSDRAWEIEKRLGQSVNLTPFHSGVNDWQVNDIARNVATRIANVATWMKDPKEREKRILAAETTRMKTTSKSHDGVVRGDRIAVLSEPKRYRAPSPKQVREALSTKIINQEKPKATAKNATSKKWTKPQTAAPIEIDIPWEKESTSELKVQRKSHPIPAIRSNEARKKTESLTELAPTDLSKADVSSLSTPSPKHPEITEPLTKISDTSPIELPAPAYPTSIEEVDTRHATSLDEDQKPALTAQVNMPSRVARIPPPALVPSSIGAQVLSSHRSMPAASFGFGQDLTIWSIPYLRRLFHDLDIDRDGYITKLEVSVALHRLQVFVPPTRITKFFQQASALSQSTKNVINFEQFYAFIIAARDAKLEPPKISRPMPSPPLPPPLPPPRTAVTLAPEPASYLENIVPDFIAAQVLERLNSAEVVPKISAEIVNQITSELLSKHVTDSKLHVNNDGGLNAMSSQLDTPSVALPELHPSTQDNIHLSNLVKSLLLDHVLHTEESNTPTVLSGAEQLLKDEDNAIPEETNEVVQLPVVEPEAQSDSKELKEEAEIIQTKTLVEQSTDTCDLEIVSNESEPIRKNIMDLPGKTLLGKILHCDSLGECDIRTDSEYTNSLSSTIRSMRVKRLNRKKSTPLPPPPPPSPPVSPRQKSPVSKLSVIIDQNAVEFKQAHLSSPPLVPAIQTQVPICRDISPPSSPPPPPPPLPTRLHVLQEYPKSSHFTFRSSFHSIVSSSSGLSSKGELNDPREELLSEGELLLPDSFSDGEIEGPSRYAYYHLHRQQFQPKFPGGDTTSSMEEGELDTYFIDDDSVEASSTGSIESGQCN